MKKSIEELYENLKEQIMFLVMSSNLYDQQVTAEAKRLATGIRTLVHDTNNNSTSLLTHLNIKKRIYFYNTAIPNSSFGLCGIRTSSESPYGKTEYYAPLDSGGEKRKEKPWVTFENWWEEMVVLTDGKNNFTRKELVKSVANKDGGTHIDINITGKYLDISRNNSLNIFHLIPSNNPIAVDKVELASVRQITFELLKTLHSSFPEYFSTHT
jgi:hypothetical protein